MSVVAIVGSRGYPNRDHIRRTVEALAARGPVTIISGGARGTDSHVRAACRDLRFHFCQEDPDPNGLEHLPLPHHFYEFLPDWSKGKGAGFDRNTEIVRHATRVVAFLAPGRPTSGTSDTIDKAKAAHLPVDVFHEGRWQHFPIRLTG